MASLSVQLQNEKYEMTSSVWSFSHFHGKNETVFGKLVAA